jgi:hypothetical protein
MKIAQLLEFVEEGSFGAMNQIANQLNDPAIKKSIARNAAKQPKATGTTIVPTNATTNGVTQQAPAINAKVSPTGDPTLDQPLAPADPNKPGLATRIGQGIGQVGKAVGAVGGTVAGVGRAIKKGYGAAADLVGGPGAAPSGAGQMAPAGAGGAGGNELADLQARLQAMDSRLRRLGV